MQLRSIAALAALGVVAAGAYAPATAAPKKFAGSYDVTLLPDPTVNAFAAASMRNCQNVNPQAVDRHALAVPRAGRLNVVLDSADPTGAGVTDWDLYLLDKDGEDIGDSHGGTSHEEVDIKLKSAQSVTVVVCNVAGQPQAKVTYSLK